MARVSIDSSERPMMSPSETSFRKTNYASSVHSISSLNSTATVVRELKQIRRDLSRLDNASLSEQRFVISERKKEEMNATGLGAKVERALSRRLVNQDYVPKTKPVMNEKVIDVKA